MPELSSQLASSTYINYVYTFKYHGCPVIHDILENILWEFPGHRICAADFRNVTLQFRMQISEDDLVNIIRVVPIARPIQHQMPDPNILASVNSVIDGIHRVLQVGLRHLGEEVRFEG